MGHAQYSPSNRYQRKRCPGSVRAQLGYPDSSGPAAIDGTHTHTLLSTCGEAGMISAFTYLGQELSDDEGSFIVTSDRCERVNLALDYIRKRVEELQELHGEVEVFFERRVSLEYLCGRNDMGGTADVIIVWGSGFEIIDYKDGMNDATVSAREQMEQYGVGHLSDMRIPHNLIPNGNARLTVIQPKLAVKKMNPITNWDVPIDYLKSDVVGALVAEVAQAEDPNAPLIAGELQCKYCKHVTCNERNKTVMNKMNLIPALDISSQAANIEVGSMSDEQIADILEAEPLMKQLVEKAKEEAESRIRSGKAFPRFKLVSGRGSRAWNLKDEEIAEKLKKMGVPKDSIYAKKVVSPAQAEKLAWVKGEAKVTLSARQIKTLNEEYTTHFEGKPTLAPMSDARKAITFSDAVELFPNLSETSNQIEQSNSGANSLPGVLPTPSIFSEPTNNGLPSWLK
mgnify:CR=1 FL=1